jgi:hypothetical protein
MPITQGCFSLFKFFQKSAIIFNTFKDKINLTLSQFLYFFLSFYIGFIVGLRLHRFFFVINIY